MDSDTVLASIDASMLPELLATIHRSGFGHSTRVIDPRRGDFEGQLARAGIELAETPPRHPDDPLVVVHAPSRTAQISALLREAGAAHVRSIAIGRNTSSAVMTFDPSTMARRSKSTRRIKTPIPQPTAEPSELD
jgi:hypothetical protein